MIMSLKQWKIKFKPMIKLNRLGYLLELSVQKSLGIFSYLGFRAIFVTNIYLYCLGTQSNIRWIPESDRKRAGPGDNN